MSGALSRTPTLYQPLVPRDGDLFTRSAFSRPPPGGPPRRHTSLRRRAGPDTAVDCAVRLRDGLRGTLSDELAAFDEPLEVFARQPALERDHILHRAAIRQLTH